MTHFCTFYETVNFDDPAKNWPNAGIERWGGQVFEGQAICLDTCLKKS